MVMVTLCITMFSDNLTIKSYAEVTQESIKEKEDQINEAKKAVKILGGGNVKTVFFTLSGTDYQRSLVKIDKVASTPGKYPRKAGTPSKEPIK